MSATPVLTDHARSRCREMGVSTKRAKRVVADPSITYRGSLRYRPGRRVAVSAADTIAVVFEPGRHGHPPVIVTVLWHAAEARQEGPSSDPR